MLKLLPAAGVKPIAADDVNVGQVILVAAIVLGVVPPIAPGDGKLVTFCEPLKLLPPMVLVVVSVAALPVVFWFNVGNVQFARLPLVGVPSIGVTKVGLVPNTNAPLPVLSLITPASCADVVEANCDRGLAVRPILLLTWLEVTLPHDEAVLTPPLSSTLPVATAESLASDVVPSA